MGKENYPDLSSWRLKDQRYRLIGNVCECGEKYFPPRNICTSCHEKVTEPYQFAGTGFVYSFTKVYDAPEGYENQVPYIVAEIILTEGPMVCAQLTDTEYEDIVIGSPVEVTFRILNSGGNKGTIVYGYKFTLSHEGPIQQNQMLVLQDQDLIVNHNT